MKNGYEFYDTNLKEIVSIVDLYNHWRYVSDLTRNNLLPFAEYLQRLIDSGRLLEEHPAEIEYGTVI